MTDDRLIRKIKRADRQAADQLISRYYDEIYVFVYRQIFDKQNAMDVTPIGIVLVFVQWRELPYRESNY